MVELANFIKSASLHEKEARGKLENFISAILERAQKAEDEVRKLRTQASLSPLLQGTPTPQITPPGQGM